MTKPRSNEISARQANWRQTQPRPARPQRGPTWGARISPSKLPPEVAPGSEHMYARTVYVHAPDETQAKWEAQGLCRPGEELDEVWRVGPERQFNYEYARSR